ncbi:BolA family transcriptional regulator [Bradyrhizobium archetypum]|uniref:BolA family transcriptional regulator n=1 Tax=Bradyrhizobium archetypum TaxID=2721160 RepID=UPI0035E2451E
MVGPDIEALIRKAFPEAEVSVTDVAGKGDHYGARIIPRAFTVKSRSSIRFCMQRSRGQWVTNFTRSR